MRKFSIPPLKSFLCIVFLCICSCNKFNLSGWAPQVLAPLVGGYATVEELTDLRNKIFHQNINPGDLHYGSYNFTGYTGPVPALSISEVGPYPYSLSQFFNSVYVDSAELTITIQNSFPITISAGTQVVFRTQPDTTNPNNIVLNYPLPQDIGPYQTTTFTTFFYNTYVKDSVFMYLENFKSPGATNATFTTTPSVVTFQINFLTVYTVALNINKNYTLLDTTSVSITQSTGNYNDSTATGLVRVFFTNAMPVNYNFQIYFLDAGMNLIDSLNHGSDMAVKGGTTNAQGVLLDSVLPPPFNDTLSAARIGLLKSANYMVFRLTGDTYNYPSPYDWVGANCYLHILLTGNLKIQASQIF